MHQYDVAKKILFFKKEFPNYHGDGINAPVVWYGYTSKILLRNFFFTGTFFSVLQIRFAGPIFLLIQVSPAFPHSSFFPSSNFV